MTVARRKRTWKTLVATLVLLLPLWPAGSARAQDETRGDSPPDSLRRLPDLPLLADFNEDQIIDEAQVIPRGSSKTIRIVLSQGETRRLSIQAEQAASGVLLAGDIDQDRDQDLLWAPYPGALAVFIWLGNGRGDFEAVTDPQAYAAAAGKIAGQLADERLSGARSMCPPSCSLSSSSTDKLATAEPGLIPYASHTGTNCSPQPSCFDSSVIGPANKRDPPMML